MKDKINKLKEKLIIETSNKYFKTEGYAGTQIDKIAKELGIGVGTIYSMFGSKEGLFLSWLFSIIDKFYEELKIKFEKEQNPLRQCEIFVDFKLGYYEKNKSILRDYMQNNQLFLKNTSRRKENPMRKVYTLVAQSIEHLPIEKGAGDKPQDFYLFAYLLDSIINSYIERFCDSEENVNFTTKTKDVMEMFLKCMGVKDFAYEA